MPYEYLPMIFSELKTYFWKPQKIYTVFYNIPRFVHDFTPLWWAPTPMLQTIVSKYFNVPQVRWKHVYLTFKDGVRCRLDYIDPDVPFKGILLLFHGLGGSSDSSYCKNIAHDFGNEYKVIVYNRRAHVHDSISHIFPTHYDKEDLDCVLDYTKNVAKGRPIYGIGFSCGANMLMRYVGESGESCVFKKVLSCGNAWDYNHATSNIKSELMEKMLCRFSKCIYLHVNPSPKSSQYSSFRQLEMHNHGYKHEKELVDYYNKVSAINYVKNIKVPSLCLDSYDDPFYRFHDMDSIISLNPKLSFIFTSYGGHVAWIESIWPKKSTYYSSVLKNWLEYV